MQDPGADGAGICSEYGAAVQNPFSDAGGSADHSAGT